MGWNKKTWLALALAIVLVLGLSVSASAAGVIEELASPAATLYAAGSTAADNETTVSFQDSTATGTAIDVNLTVKSTSTGTVELSKNATTKVWTIKGKTAGTVTLVASATDYASIDVGPIGVLPYGVKYSPESITLNTTSSTKGTSTRVSITDLNGTALTGDDITVTVPTVSTNNLVSAVYTSFYKQWTIESENILGTGDLTVAYKDDKGKLAANPQPKLAISVVPAAIQVTYDNEEDVLAPGKWNMKMAARTSPKAAPEVPASTADFVAKDEKGNPILKDVTFTVTPSGAATIGALDVTTGKVVVTAAAAGKFKITATYGSLTASSTEVEVFDPSKVSEIAVQKRTGGLPLIGGTYVTLDPTKDSTTQDLPFVAGKNLHTFKVDVLPETALVYDELDTGKSDNVKWTTTTPKLIKIVAQEKWVAGETGIGTNVVGTAKYPYETVIEVVGTGTAKLKVTVDGVSRTFTFKVSNSKATAIADLSAMKLVKDQYKQVTVTTTPADARVKLTYKSNKKSVATVTSAGVVKGIKKGTATITVKDSISGISKKMTVTVDNDYSKVNYAGYVLMPADTDTDTATYYDNVGLAVSVIRACTYNGKLNSKWGYDTADQFAKKTDLLDAIKAAAWQEKQATDPAEGTYASDDDVFMFVYAGPVNSNGDIELQPASTTGIITPAETVTFDEIAEALTSIKGTIVVIADCKTSSQLLTTKGVTALTPAQVNNKIINTFAKKSAQVKAKTIGTAAAAADSYKQKFKVITSTSKKSQASGTYSLATATSATETDYETEYWLIDALWTGLNPVSLASMPADSNRNGLVTLKELYNYTNKRIKSNVAKAKKDGTKVTQSIAVYPSKGDGFAVYARLLKPTVK